MELYGIIFPVYNEEKRLESGIRRAISFFEQIKIEYSCIIVDNASTDATDVIARKLCSEYPRLSYIKIKEKGVGAAFRAGVEQIETNIIGYMDVDLSTDIIYFRDVVDIFEKHPDTDMVNASRFNKKSVTVGRKWYRNITSYGLVFMLKFFLGMEASDAICGFKFFRRSSVVELIKKSSDENGWFYIIELLIRAEKGGMKVEELPVRWEDEITDSKVDVIKTVMNYTRGIANLRKSLKRKL